MLGKLSTEFRDVAVTANIWKFLAKDLCLLCLFLFFFSIINNEDQGCSFVAPKCFQSGAISWATTKQVMIHLWMES